MMAYKRPEHLGSQGERRVIGILTLTNVAGGFAGLAGLWMLAGLLGLGSDQILTVAWCMRALLAVAGAVIGVLATFRWSGISLWDTVVLWGGYQIRRSLGHTLLAPPVVGRVANQRVMTPIMRAGAVVAEVYDPHEAALMAGAEGESHGN